jgi:hypothetical protein
MTPHSWSACATVSAGSHPHPATAVDREGTILVAFASRLPGEEPDPDHSFDVYAATIETVRAQVKRRRR